MKFTIPSRFTLGSVEHTVEVNETVGDDLDFGQYDSVGKVKIAKRVSTADVSDSKMKQTFFHELTHAILITMRKDELNEDESFVNTFASFLYEAIDTMEE